MFLFNNYYLFIFFQGSTYFINLVAHYPVSLVVDSIKPHLPILYWLNKKLCNTPRDFYKLKYETYYVSIINLNS